jgi:hypothetical protein
LQSIVTIYKNEEERRSEIYEILVVRMTCNGMVGDEVVMKIIISSITELLMLQGDGSGIERVAIKIGE